MRQTHHETADRPPLDGVSDVGELDDRFAEPQRVARALNVVPPTAGDRYDTHTHELSDAAAEAVSRLLIRVVPLAYGGLLGWLADMTPFGLLLGAAASAAFDVHMAQHSLLRRGVRWVRHDLCPRLQRAGQGIARLAARLGVALPRALRRLPCA